MIDETKRRILGFCDAVYSRGRCFIHIAENGHFVFRSMDPPISQAATVRLTLRCIFGSAQSSENDPLAALASTKNESSAGSPGIPLLSPGYRLEENVEPPMSSDLPFVLRWGIISTGAIAASFVSVRALGYLYSDALIHLYRTF